MVCFSRSALTKVASSFQNGWEITVVSASFQDESRADEKSRRPLFLAQSLASIFSLAAARLAAMRAWTSSGRVVSLKSLELKEEDLEGLFGDGVVGVFFADTRFGRRMVDDGPFEKKSEMDFWYMMMIELGKVETKLRM